MSRVRKGTRVASLLTLPMCEALLKLRCSPAKSLCRTTGPVRCSLRFSIFPFLGILPSPSSPPLSIPVLLKAQGHALISFVFVAGRSPLIGIILDPNIFAGFTAISAPNLYPSLATILTSQHRSSVTAVSGSHNYRSLCSVFQHSHCCSTS